MPRGRKPQPFKLGVRVTWQERGKTYRGKIVEVVQPDRESKLWNSAALKSTRSFIVKTDEGKLFWPSVKSLVLL
jgi:hypothetical protein